MKWQPISTAPKNSSLILVETTDHKIYAVYWNSLYDRWFNQDGFVIVAPEYWMPLPEPPKG